MAKAKAQKIVESKGRPFSEITQGLIAMNKNETIIVSDTKRATLGSYVYNATQRFGGKRKFATKMIGPTKTEVTRVA